MFPVLGMIDAGLGESNINKLFAALNIPVVNPRHLKKWEGKVGKAIETVAREACQEALEEEVNRCAIMSGFTFFSNFSNYSYRRFLN